MTERLNEIEERAEKATPGPWTATTGDSVAGGTIYDGEWSIASATIYNHNNPLSNKPGSRGPGYIDTDANADFIAHARSDIPYLLAEIERLNGKIAEVWDEGAVWAAIECGVIDRVENPWLAPGDNPYRRNA